MKQKNQMPDNSKEKIKKNPAEKDRLELKNSKMSLAIIMYIGWKNLRVGKMRSALTIGGVALGIGVMTSLLSLGFGLQNLIVNEVTQNNPREVIDINNGSLDNFVTLNDETIEKIKNMDGVLQVERRINTGGKVIFGESQTDAVIFGANTEYLRLARLNFKGKENDFSGDAGGVVVSDRLARLLGFENPLEAVGKDIKVDVAVTKEVSSQAHEETVKSGNEMRVIGIMENQSSPFVYVSYDRLRKDFWLDLAQSGKIYVAKESLYKFDNIKQQVEQLGFIAESINDVIADIDSFFNTARAVLMVFGVIIMSISVMGMLNTLSISLLQRTREIGILKALGAKRADIFKMFVIESIIISFVGGIVGFFGGYGGALLVNKILSIVGKNHGVDIARFVDIPFFFVAMITVFVFFLGLFTGLMPAFRAAKIHALEALRYE